MPPDNHVPTQPAYRTPDILLTELASIVSSIPAIEARLVEAKTRFNEADASRHVTKIGNRGQPLSEEQERFHDDQIREAFQVVEALEMNLAEMREEAKEIESHLLLMNIEIPFPVAL